MERVDEHQYPRSQRNDLCRSVAMGVQMRMPLLPPSPPAALRGLAFLLVATVMTTLAWVPSADAAADPAPTARRTDPQSLDNLDPTTLALMHRQNELQPALTEIWEEQLRTEDSGFAGVAFEGDGLSIYWKGTLTSGMAAAVSRARRTGPVTVKPAAFTAAELRDAGDAIHAAIDRRGLSEIQSIGYDPSGAGLDIERAPASTTARLAAAQRRAGRPEPATAEQILADARVSVPVRLSTADQDEDLLASRRADSAPWNGGGRMESWRDGGFRMACTTGFGVHSDTRSFVLTAGHCASRGDTVYQGIFGGGSGTTFKAMGGVSSDYWEYDLLLVNTSGWYLIFDGGPTTSTTKRVNSWGYWAANELVCHSGSVSGTVCGLRQLRSKDFRVSADSPDSDGDYGYVVRGVIETIQADGRTAAQRGDSGGPVFTLNGTGVRAKGIVSGGGGTIMNFQDWQDVIRLFGAYPNTSSSTS
nr:trypsin-like serine protease [Micromonospora sp. DSM 115978]